MDDALRDDGTGRAGDGLLEDVRALAEGRLAPAEVDELLLRASSDPDDAALVEAFREVHAVTAVIDDEMPPCRVRFEDVEARIDAGRGRILRPWALRAAAAVLLVAVAIGGFAVLAPPSAPVVELASVHLAAAPPETTPEAAAALAAAAPLADFVPLRDGEPQWLGSLDEGRAVARATGRPVLLFIHHPTCPICLDLRDETFSDAGVQERLGRFVPVKVNVMELPESLQPYLGRGWPYLGALDAAGEELSAFPGMSGPDKMRLHLDEALSEPGAAEPLAWGPARARAMRLRDAVAAGEAGDLAREHDELTALAQDAAGDAFGAAARTILARRAAEAAAALREAAVEIDAAGARLDRAAERFAGTPWGTDLERVRDAFRETGRFPRLEPPSDQGGR